VGRLNAGSFSVANRSKPVILFAARAQTEKGDVRTVNFVAGLLLELFEKNGELVVLDFDGMAASPAD
jgi:hypothetical protein